MIKNLNISYLIAMPQLRSPHFEKSLILLLEHDQEGAMGIILNKFAELTLSDFAKDQELECHPRHQKKPVYYGGPVSIDHGWILHNNKNLPDSQEISENLYLSGSLGALEPLLKDPESEFKLILGYSGWEAGQLEKELKMGSWLMSSFIKDFIFMDQSDDNDIWKKIINTLGINPHNLSDASSGGLVH